jgi:hypothetical protein
MTGNDEDQKTRDLEHYSSRIKLGKKVVDFEKNSCFQRPPTGHCMLLPDNVRLDPDNV